MWFRTVSTLRKSSAAIWLVERPQLEQAQHLGLAGSQVRMRRRRRLVDLDVDDLPEHPDHLIAVSQGNGADVDRDALAVEPHDDDFVVGALDGSGHVAREDLPSAASLLRREDGRELPSAHVADDLPRRRVDPAHDAVTVDHVRGHADLLQRAGDVVAHVAQARHLHRVCGPAAPRVKSGGFDLDRRTRQELPVDLARFHDVDASVELEPDGAERFPRHPVLDGPHERCEVRA